MPYAFLPDTSVVYNGKILELIESGKLDSYTPVEKDNVRETERTTLVLSRVMLSEIENQANKTKSQKDFGLEVLHELHGIKRTHNIEIEIFGKRPKLEHVRLNPGGELDALIRKDALKNKAVLVTADNVQSGIAVVEGVDVLYSEARSEYEEEREAEIEQMHEMAGAEIQDFFDSTSMSVHLRGHCVPMAKRGRPGEWRLEPISDEVMPPAVVSKIANKIIRQAKNDEESFIERNSPGVTVVQLRNYRIVICRPPFSNIHEVTAVKPIVSLELEDYNLP